ncbi:MAG TPA: hypothetical protein VGK33_15860, partial [Chloroflexota bacterium]
RGESEAAGDDEALVRRARAILSEDLVAEQTYRQLAGDLHDPSADAVFGLLLRETEEQCLLLQRIVEGTMLASERCSPPAGGAFAKEAPQVRAMCLDIQELARGNRRHAGQLRDLACAARGRGQALLGAILDALARDSDKHASLLLELAVCLHSPATR